MKQCLQLVDRYVFATFSFLRCEVFWLDFFWEPHINIEGRCGCLTRINTKSAPRDTNGYKDCISPVRKSPARPISLPTMFVTFIFCVRKSIKNLGRTINDTEHFNSMHDCWCAALLLRTERPPCRPPSLAPSLLYHRRAPVKWVRVNPSKSTRTDGMEPQLSLSLHPAAP